ncbi:MAG TPA: MBL fold metallo-hydrolase [Dongiaceae bacterium]|nr:MBL fold metallo-hydrolase [Dongiaceae bacterium]
MTTFTTIDLNWTGRAKAIAALLVESADACAIVDPGPESTLEHLQQGLRSRGQSIASVQAILLTHIHLDHAGATGALIRQNPKLRVYVHEFGAVHMADPSRLLASAGRLYGGDMQALYGDCQPVPQEHLQPLEGGEILRVGEAAFSVHYTPGHASHHVSFWHEPSRTALVGDTAGIRVQGDSFLLPATPPPDVEMDLWKASLDAIASWNPERLFLTHFGFIEQPREHIRRYKERLDDWTALTRRFLQSGMELPEAEKAFVDAVASEVRSALPPEPAEQYILNGGLRLSWLGLLRYVRKTLRP